MRKWTLALTALVAGAAAMYCFDPQQGRRRRALMAQQVRHAGHAVGDGARRRGKRLADRLRGLQAVARRWLSPMGERPSDAQVHARVRANLGHCIEHPHAVTSEFCDGRLTLRGQLPQAEIDSALAALRRLPGVRRIDNRLQPAGGS